MSGRRVFVARRVCLGVAVLLVSLGALLEAIQSQAHGTLADLMTTVLDGYAGTMSTEHYRQTGQRKLVDVVSEFTPIRENGSWIGVRRIQTVNGRLVADTDARLLEIVKDGLEPESTRRLAVESARFNDGDVTRTVNHPAAVLALLDPRPDWRVTFGETTTGERDGEQMYATAFAEHRRPTLVRTAAGADVPGSGRVWVNAAGHLAYVEVEFPLVSSAGVSSQRKAVISLSFASDRHIGATVPVRMHERYLTAAGFAFFDGVATYVDYRRFDVLVSETPNSRDRSGR